MVDIRVDRLGDKPLLYDRSTVSDYGKGGIAFRPSMNPAFATACEGCFAELILRLALAADLQVETILSGGVSRAGTGSSFHHKNRAFDFDGLLFKDGTTWVANTFPLRRQLYLGLEAVLRMHFGTVLTFDYNKAHEDHFHFDNGTTVGFKTAAKSHVIFIQNVIAFVYATPIGRDGLWGGETEGALKALRARLEIGPLSNQANWRAFLAVVAEDAMALDKNRR